MRKVIKPGFFSHLAKRQIGCGNQVLGTFNPLHMYVGQGPLAGKLMKQS